MALFWRGTGTNWSDTTAWSTTDGGGSAGVIPTATDDVNFTANGNGTNCTLDTAVNKVAKTLTVNGFTGTLTFNVQLSVSGSITFTTTSFTLAGASKLRMIAAGTITTNGRTIGLDLEIGGTTTFTCTLADNLTCNGTNGLLLTNTTSTIFSGAHTITSQTGLTVSGSQTITLSGNVTVSGGTTISDANVINGSFSWTTQNLTTTGALTGTATFHLSGSGTWSGAAACSCSVIIDGDTTLSGTVLYSASGTPTLTLNTGSLTGSGTLSIASACTIVGATNRTISNLTITAAITLTLNTVVVAITGILTCPNAAVTFAGNVGFTVGTTANTAIASSAKTYTFTQGNTYTISGSQGWTGATATLTLTLASSSGSLKTVVTLSDAASQDSAYMNGTRIDSSNGQAIYSYNNSTTACFNWATTIQGGNLSGTSGAALTVSGVTYNKVGSILGSCTVVLFSDNGDGTFVYVGNTTSDPSTGAYSFTVFPGSTYFAVAWLNGSPDVFDVTDRTLVAA